MTDPAAQDDFSELFAPEPPGPLAQPAGDPWKVLLVDDEPDILAVISLALRGVLVEGRPLLLFEARSAAQARERLQEHPDLSLMLVDVVMETSDAGLMLVRHVRESLGNRTVQIVLLTGQPGYAPQREIITRYAVDGYRLKSELSADMIFTTVYGALRACGMLRELAQQRELLVRQAQELRVGQETLSSLIESAPDAIIQADHDGVIVGWNGGACRMFGYAREEVLGQPITRLMPERYRSRHTAKMHGVRDGDRVPALGRMMELEGLRKDGTEFPIELLLGTWKTPTGAHFNAVARDVTGRHRMDAELASYRDNLEAIVDGRTRELALHARRAEALLELPEMLAHVGEESFLAQVIAILCDLTESRVGFLHLASDDQRTLQRMAVSSTALQDGNAGALPLEENPGPWFDALKRARVVHGYVSTYAGGAIAGHRLLSVPIFDGGRVRMVATVGRADGSFSGVDTHTLRLVAGSTWRLISRRRVEDALEEEQQRFRATFDYAAVGIAMVSLDGRILEANLCMCEMLGYSVGELRSRPAADVLHPDDRETREKQLNLLIAGDIDRDLIEKRFVRSNGDIIWLKLSVALVRAPDGTPKYFVSVGEDISTRRMAEETVVRLSLAVEQSSDSVVITDRNARIEYANPAALRSSGYSRQELVGRNSSILQSGKTPVETYRALWAALSVGRPWQGIFVNRRRDGSEYEELARVQPIRDPAGGVTHYLAVKEDVTEKRRMGLELHSYRNHLEELVEHRTQQLAQAMQVAEQANKAKSAFLATMSHEIRTPMNGVIGLSEVLRRSSLTPYQADLAETISESAFALLRIIDDILDFSKIEAGRLELEIEPLSLGRVIEASCQALQPMAASRSVRLRSILDPGLPEWVLGDSGRLRQIVTNLVGNALKFSAGLEHPGRVDVSAEMAGPGCVRLTVSDNGIGMSAEVLERIQQPFMQGEASTTRRYGGTGLGLSICRRLIELLKGRMEISSVQGEGSSVTVEIPVVQSPTGPVRPPQIERGKGSTVVPGRVERAPGGIHPRILVAEDNEINRKVILKQLQLLGYDADAVSSGAQAIECWRSGRYGLVLTDLHMPVMDGYQLAAAIRGEEAAGLRSPILALTANAMREDLARCTDAGMDGYLVKPVALDNLSDALRRWLEAPGAERPDPAQPVIVPETPQLALLDTTVLTRLIGGDEDLKTEFLAEYLVSARTAAAQVRAAFAASDWALMGAIGHRLKSSSRSVGALVLGEICAAMEQAGKVGDAVALAGHVVAFDAALEEVRARIEGGFDVRVAPAGPLVMLVNDDLTQMRLLARMFSDFGASQIIECASGPQALAQLQGRDTSDMILVLDLTMPEMDGLEVMRLQAEGQFDGGLALLSGAAPGLMEAAHKLAKAYRFEVLGALYTPVQEAAVRAIIEKWRGRLRLDTVPGAGRTGNGLQLEDSL